MAEISCTADDVPCACLDSDLFDLLGRKYALEVICIVANHGPTRFGEVESHLPDASTSTLSTRLDELEAADLVARERYDEIPPRVEYELTETGTELGRRMEPLVEWIESASL